MQKEWLCDFVTNFSHECSRSMWMLLILRCGNFVFFNVWAFWRPLVILVLYSNGRVKLVLWTDWVSLLTNQTLQECQCQKSHRIHFGCIYQIQNCIVCLKRLLLLLFGAVLQAKNTVRRFGSESVARGKLDVLTCKHSNHFKPSTTLDPQLILKILLERFLHKKSSTKWYTRCGASWFNPRKLRVRDFKTWYVEFSKNAVAVVLPTCCRTNMATDGHGYGQLPFCMAFAPLSLLIGHQRRVVWKGCSVCKLGAALRA